MLPELIDSGDIKFLIGRVDTGHGWAEAYHIEVRILGEEESALEAGVDSLDGGLNAEEFFVGVSSDLHDGRLHVGSPTGIAVAMRHLGTGELEMSFNLTGDILLAAFY